MRVHREQIFQLDHPAARRAEKFRFENPQTQMRLLARDDDDDDDGDDADDGDDGDDDDD
jgi:hypothetical protein